MTERRELNIPNGPHFLRREADGSWTFVWDWSRWVFPTRWGALSGWRHRYCYDSLGGCKHGERECPGGLR